MTMDFLNWTKQWFSEIVEQDVDSDLNLFDSGIIDSFQLIMLIEDIEQLIDKKFTEQLMQDERLGTIRGIAKIIEELDLDV